METVVIVIHLMVIVALVAVVLLQRSEGGALGIGSANAFMTTRGQGNVLTRATGILAAAFFITSIALTVLTRIAAPPSAILDSATSSKPATTTSAPANTTGGTAGTGTSGTTAPASGGGVANELNQFLNQRNGTAAPAGGTTTAPATDSGSGAGAPATGASTTTAPAVPTSQ